MLAGVLQAGLSGVETTIVSLLLVVLLAALALAALKPVLEVWV